MAATARLLALLDLLQDRGWVSGEEIATRLEAEPRTVRRDLARLADLGLPVESRRGRYGGYRLRPGFRMPPLMLTDDEAAAVVVALVCAEHLGLTTTTPAVTGALSKIRRVLPLALRDRTRALEESLGFSRGPVDASDLDAPVLLGLGEAVRNRRRVQFGYTARDGDASERTVDPYGLVVVGRRWYVPALDHDRGALRVFRADRVRDVRAVGAAAPPPDGFDPVAAVSQTLSRTPWRWEVVVLVRAPVEVVRSRLPAWVAELVEDGDGVVRASFRAEDLHGAARLLAGLGLPLEVQAPEELRVVLADHARSLLAASGSAPRS